MRNNRDNSTDIAKGIGIILVVWGHTFTACPFLGEICLFHMPLFFLISGCFIQESENIKLFIYKKIRTLLIPFIVFYGGSLIIKIFLYVQRGEMLFDLITNTHFYSLSVINYPLWFLVCLFILVILYFAILKITANTIYQNVVIISLTTIGYLLVYEQIRLPLYLTQALIVLPFIHIGRLYYNNKKSYSNIVHTTIIVISLLSFLLGVTLHIKTDIGSLTANHNFLLFYLPGFGGSFLTLKLSEWISEYKWSKFLSQLGIYSLFIFAIHANMGFLDGVFNHIAAYIYQFAGYSPQSQINHAVLFGIVKTIICIPICYVIGIFLKKYFPYLWNYNKNDFFIKKLRE